MHHSNWILFILIGSYFTNYSKTITHQAEIFQGQLSYHRYLYTM